MKNHFSGSMRWLRPAVAALVVLGLCGRAPAINIYWNASSGNWSEQLKWNPQQVPTFSDDVYVNIGGTVNVIGASEARSLMVGESSGQSGHVVMSGGSLIVPRHQTIGGSGTGSFTQSGGNNYSSYGENTYELRIGHSSGSVGIYTLTGGTLQTAYQYIGRLGTGTFIHTGGTNRPSSSGSLYARHMYIGHATSSAYGTGLYHLSGTGQIEIGHRNANINVGVESSGTIPTGRFEWFRSGGITWNDNSGSGSIEIGAGGTLAMGYDFSALPQKPGGGNIVTGLENGTMEVTNGATVTKTADGVTSAMRYLRIGSASGAGYANQTGGTVQVGQTAWIGDGGTGAATQSGGSFNVAFHLYLGHNGGSGTYTLGNGTLTVGSNLFVSDSSSGRLVLDGGTMNVQNIFFPGAGGTGTGTVVLDGGTLNNTGSTFRTTNLNLGERTGRTGNYTLVTGKTLTATDLRLGMQGTGNFTQSGGTANVTNLRFGTEAAGSGSYLLNGGTLNVGGQVFDGPGAGTIQIDGGTFNPSGSVAVDNLKVGITAAGSHTQVAGRNYTVGMLTLGNATYRLGGGTLSADGVANTTGTGTLNIDGGTFSPSGNVDVDNLGVGILSAGSHTQAAHLYQVGTLALGSGSYLLSGGTLQVGGNVVNGSGTGMLALNGGSFSVTGSVDVDQLQVGVNATAVHTVSGGIWQSGSVVFGAQAGGAGTLTLAGGSLTAAAGISTGTGTGTLVLNGGSLLLGGDVGVTHLTVGSNASASFTQAARKFNVAGDLNVGSGTGSGSYRFDGTAELAIGNDLNIGTGGATGRFEWYRSGGMTTSGMIRLGGGGTLAMGHNFDLDQLADGISGLADATLEVTRSARGTLDVGTVTARNVQLGGSDGSGTLRVEGGGALAIATGGSLNVGTAAQAGRFEWHHAGGLSTPALAVAPQGTLAMGFDFNVADLLDGTLIGGGTVVGLDRSTTEVTSGATATHTGVNAKFGRLELGSPQGSGTWGMEAGALNVSTLIIGNQGSGKLEIHNPAASVTVGQTLLLGRQATLEAVPGSRITLTGSDVWIHGNDPAMLAGMANVTLAFQPIMAGGMLDHLELAGRDLGVTMDGFSNNFALHTLVVGSPSADSFVTLRLMDMFRNQGVDPEALYVHNIYVHEGATLDMNLLNVYYDGLLEANGAIINGTPQFIPEPAAASLLALAALAILARRRPRRSGSQAVSQPVR